jgi:hypothetical protein
MICAAEHANVELSNEAVRHRVEPVEGRGQVLRTRDEAERILEEILEDGLDFASVLYVAEIDFDLSPN